MDESFAVVAVLGSWIGMLWQILDTIVVFGLPFTTILVSGLAISIIMPFMWSFTTGAVGIAHSSSEANVKLHREGLKRAEHVAEQRFYRSLNRSERRYYVWRRNR